MSELEAGIFGGLVGGSLGLLGNAVTSYWGPRKLEQWRQSHRDQPRKELLRRLLEDERYPDGRSLDRLRVVTGTGAEECRRLLIQVNARGVILAGGEEGWALIARKPLDGAYKSLADADRRD
jgi:hypothetical protein